MNILWGLMIVIGVVYAALTGRLAAVSEEAIASAKDAVTLCITMAGVVAFWVGIMRVAEENGFVEKAVGKMTPILSFLFPNIDCRKPAANYIATNIIANILGLGWAATPAGLRAMKELKEEENCAGVATDTMCDFLILNISSLQLIPINMIAYRTQYGSVTPTAIVGPAIIATVLSSVAAILFIKIRHMWRRKA